MSAAPALFNGNGNTSQLSSSLQLSRHVLHNHQWHGSRSSVSAVENATQHQQQQAAASLSLRHSFSTSSNYTETLSSLLRKSANTCSKDTLLFIDQQSHHHTAGLIEDDDDSYMGRSLWVCRDSCRIPGGILTKFIRPVTDIARNATQTHHCFAQELDAIL